MTPKQAQELARMLRTARQARGLSAREVAKRSGINDSNVVRLEQGAILNPRPDTLKSIADVVGLDLADIYATIGYAQPEGLPSFTPYLRSKYGQLPPKAGVSWRNRSPTSPSATATTRGDRNPAKTKPKRSKASNHTPH